MYPTGGGGTSFASARIRTMDLPISEQMRRPLDHDNPLDFHLFAAFFLPHWGDQKEEEFIQKISIGNFMESDMCGQKRVGE